MGQYHNLIVVSNNLSQKNFNRIRRLIQTNQFSADRVYLLHLLPQIPALYYTIPSISRLELRLHHDAKQRLNKLSYELNIPVVNCWIQSGPRRACIRRFTQERHGVLLQDLQANIRKSQPNILKRFSKWLHLDDLLHMAHVA